MNASGWDSLVVVGLLTALAGLESRSRTGLLWKRNPDRPFRPWLGAGMIVIGILLAAFGVFIRLLPS
jgi:hypothetical protein